MIDIFFVGDGPRDGAVVPRLVERMLAVKVRDEFRQWARLHGAGAGKGYGRKLRYAIRQAKDGKADGVVATVDADSRRPSGRLKQLREARETDRAAAAPIPTAVGEAIPRLESWLLDDPVAVRRVLQLGQDPHIPTVRTTKSPKISVNELIELSDRNEEPLDLLRDIAANVDPVRCRHDSETGFKSFVDDVKQEFRHYTGTTVDSE